MVSFGKIARKLVNGGTPPTEVEAFWNGKTPWITGADFTPTGISEFRRFVSDAAIAQTSTNVIERGQLLLVTRTGVGKLAIAPCDIAISQDITGVYVDEERADTHFLFHRMRRGVEDLKKLNQGTSINGIIRSDLIAYPLELPPLPTQRRIAEILSTMDEAIEQTEALIAKYQQIKAGLMHDLFTRGVTPDGHLRPTRAQAPHLYKDSPLGWVPKEWEVKLLGAIFKQCGGYLQTGPFGSQLHAHEYQHEGVPVVMPQDINDGVISTDQIARIVERKAEELSRHRMRVGDIVIARRGELSRAAAIVESHEGWLCGTGCFLLRLGRNALHSDFAACVYRHDLIQRQITGMAVGTTMPSLNNTVMERLFFPFCDPEEQSRIIERLDNLDQFLRYIQYQALKLRQQKHGLMHDLLTGRVRVKVGESASA
jgi:type I restriction enzyme S subunit